MRAAERCAALCLALVASPTILAQLPAQTNAEPSTAWVRLPANYTPAPYVPAFGSAPAPIAPANISTTSHLVAVYAVPCGRDADANPRLCVENPYSRFLDSVAPIPLTPSQKANLALRNLFDPVNLATIGDTAAITVAADSHTAFGPGWSGFLRDSHYSFAQDATTQFFATFLIPSLVHQDPHYHRMPEARIPRRILHAVAGTVIAQRDSGAPVLNYATLLSYPITAEIGNLYIPGVHDNASSTATRILTGYATDPASNLLAEFFPTVARHINLRVILAQRLLN